MMSVMILKYLCRISEEGVFLLKRGVPFHLCIGVVVFTPSSLGTSPHNFPFVIMRLTKRLCAYRFSLIKETLIEFNQLAMANAEGSDHMLNRVMTKDNIGLTALLETKAGVYENGK